MSPGRPAGRMTRSGIDLAARDPDAVERMDSPDCDPDMLVRTYAGFRVVNAVVAGWHQVYRTLLRPAVRSGKPLTVLDVGFGGGDMPRALARWSARDGNRLTITAIDPDPRALHFAGAKRRTPGVEFRCARTTDVLSEGGTFDFVLSNHLLHHLTDREFADLLDETRRLTRFRAVHSDIARSLPAYLAFSAATLPFFRGSYIRPDGLASIRRSYTTSELRSVLPAGWRLMTQFPARNLLVFDRDGVRA